MIRNLIFICVLISLISCREEKKVKVIRDGKVVEITESELDAQSGPKRHVAPADGKYPEMEFSETEFDFGNIAQGDKVTHVFHFRNSGEADLQINDAKGSCGCTVPEYPKEQIAPGQSGEIKVSFNSAGKSGDQRKSVTLMTNTENGTEQLFIKASINPGNGLNPQPVATPKS